MSSYRRWTAFIMTALLLSGTAAAQSPGTLLVGGFGQYTHFDSKWNLDTGLGNSLGFGWRFGGYFAPGWNLEGEGFYTPASSNPGVRFLNSAKNAPGGSVKASTLAIGSSTPSSTGSRPLVPPRCRWCPREFPRLQRDR